MVLSPLVLVLRGLGIGIGIEGQNFDSIGIGIGIEGPSIDFWYWYWYWYCNPWNFPSFQGHPPRSSEAASFLVSSVPCTPHSRYLTSFRDFSLLSQTKPHSILPSPPGIFWAPPGDLLRNLFHFLLGTLRVFLRNLFCFLLGTPRGPPENSLPLTLCHPLRQKKFSWAPSGVLLRILFCYLSGTSRGHPPGSS